MNPASVPLDTEVGMHGVACACAPVTEIPFRDEPEVAVWLM